MRWGRKLPWRDAEVETLSSFARSVFRHCWVQCRRASVVSECFAVTATWWLVGKQFEAPQVALGRRCEVLCRGAALSPKQ